MNITKEQLYTREEVLNLGITNDKLKLLIRNQQVTVVKSHTDKRFTYFLKSEMDLLVKLKDNFYIAVEKLEL
jgi:hypothetical protein